MTCTIEAPAAAALPRDLDSVALELLGERICEGAGHLAAATGAWLRLVEEFDRRQGWAEWGVKSCAHWLSWKCGIGLVTGREHVRVARALVDLPAIGAALAAGRLSYSKVRALTRVATPESETDLLQIALSSTGAQLDQLTAGLRRAGSLDDVNARHEARSVSWWWAEDGSLHLRAKLSPEDGALLLAALDAARGALAQPPQDDGEEDAPRPTLQQGNADALVVLAETLIATGPAPAPGGERHQVNIHTELDSLVRDGAAERAPARIVGGPALHPETLRRLCCDSGAVIVAHHESSRSGRRRGTWMDVGRRTRVVSAGLRRALTLRDHGCRFPGCTETRFVDAHHVLYWSRGGLTALANLVLLCRRHHRHVHEGGYQVVADGIGGFDFRRPDGLLLPDVPSARTGVAEALPGMHGAEVSASTAMPNWAGERLDIDYAVSVLTQQPRPSSAEARSATPPADPSLN